MDAIRFVVACLLVCRGLSHESEGSRRVAEFVTEVLSLLPKCSLVIAHDFLREPDWLVALAKNMSDHYRFALTFRPPEWFVVPSHKSVRDLWDWFERRKKAGECVVHLVTSDTLEGFRRVALFHAFTIAVESFRDYFVIWVRNPTNGSSLLMDVSRGWALKVSVQRNDLSLDLHTLCFYCDKGEPAVKFLSRYPEMVPISVLFPGVEQDFNQKHFSVPFYKAVNQKEVDEKVRKGGLWSLDIEEMGMYEMGRHYNYRWDAYTQDLAPQEIYMSRMSNGSWIGLVGELMKGRADFLYIALYQADAMTHVNFAFPFAYSGFSFVTSRAGPVWSWETIFWPYQWTVWLSVGAGSAVGILIGWRLLEKGYNGQSSGALLFVSQYLLQSFLEQLPNRSVPASNPFRVFVVFWLFFAIVITCGYQEMVFLFVAVPVKEVLPRTFDDLLSMGYQVGAEQVNGIGYSIMIQDLELPTYQRVKSDMVLHSSYESCFKRCLETKAACMGIKGMLEIEVWKFGDETGHIPYILDGKEVAINLYTGPAYPKDNPAFASGHHTVMWCFESGIHRRYINIVSYMNFLRSLRLLRSGSHHDDPKDEVLGEDEEEERKPLTTKKLYGPFGLVVTGWVVSIVGFVYEVAKHKGTTLWSGPPNILHRMLSAAAVKLRRSVRSALRRVRFKRGSDAIQTRFKPRMSKVTRVTGIPRNES